MEEDFEDQRAGGQLHRAIAQRLGMAIIAGEVGPGETLTTEIAASHAMGVSRSAYREAICILQAKGLVDSRRKVGTRVTEKRRWNLLDPDVLTWSFAQVPTVGLLDGLFELRGIIEPQAAFLAAECHTASQAQALRQVLLQAETGDDLNRMVSAARQFHDLVLEATANPALISLSAAMGAIAEWTTFLDRHRLSAEALMAQYWRVLDAIAQRQPQRAHEAMTNLISSSLEAARP